MARYIVSHRLSDKTDADARAKACDSFQKTFDTQLAKNIQMRTEQPTPKGRRIYMFDAEPNEIEAKRKDLGEDALIEVPLEREPAVTPPLAVRQLRAIAAQALSPPGEGETFDMTIAIGGRPAEGVKVTFFLTTISGQATEVVAHSDQDGKASTNLDPDAYRVTLAWIEPTADAWSMVVSNPANGITVDCPVIAFNGPLGWWHYLVGQVNLGRGDGVRVGVIDTGCGPNANLAHVHGVGAFLDGNHIPGEQATLDARNHGTHVCGIIGARPPQDSKQYSGIAPEVELYAARVFTKDANANQGDIANAIEFLSEESEVNLINLSLGGAPSEIEADAIATAFLDGVLCIAAAGNNHGGPVLYPGAYPTTAAVSAIGMLDMYPHGSTSSTYVPTQASQFSPLYSSIFLASFSNIGPAISVTAPGNAIISTVPSTNGGAPYLAMDGTSMATPAATAALANALTGHSMYQGLKGYQRSHFAFGLLQQKAFNLGLSFMQQGAGLARV